MQIFCIVVSLLLLLIPLILIAIAGCAPGPPKASFAALAADVEQSNVREVTIASDHVVATMADTGVQVRVDTPAGSPNRGKLIKLLEANNVPFQLTQ